MLVGPRTSGSSTPGNRRLRLGVVAFATVVVMTLGAVDVAVQTPMAPPSEVGGVVQLSPAEARQAAQEAREGSTIQLADGLEIDVWATPHMVADALAIDLDSHGVAYVASSRRSGRLNLLDTRQHPTWLAEIHALKTTEDLRQFFRRKMAPELSDENTWLTDYNGDGVRDYRDLAVVQEKIFRIEDTDGDGVADKSTLVFSGFHEDIAADILGGVMAHESGDIYATIAPDVWRLRDTDGDGVLDFKESISHGYSVHPSFAGHELSALTQGPDGMIYWKVGEIGMNVVDKAGKRWAHPNTGAVLRSNPDGTDFEVYAYGVRNPQEIAFDEYGNLVSVDNDGDYPTETERVIYIAEGSDTGWRSTWQYGKYTDPDNNRYNPWMDEGMSRVRFDGQPAYITPPIAPHMAGPSGFAYNPGTALDPSWNNYFFVTSFTGNTGSARVFAFKLAPKGAGFELAENKEIVRGLLSPGMQIGPDGAFYFTDWMQGWDATGQGRIWKLDSIEGKSSPIRAEVKMLLAASFADRPASSLVELLAHADMRVRMKAQFELARRSDQSSLSGTARSSADQLARIHAIWGLGQLLRSGGASASAVVPFLKDADAEIRAQAAKVLGHARSREAADALVPLVLDEHPRVRYFSSIALGRIGHRPAMKSVVAMLAADNEADVYLRNAGVVAFEGIGDRAGLAALAGHESRGVRLAAVIALRRLRDPGVARFLDDRDVLVLSEAAGAINDEEGIEAALPALARLLERPSLEREPLVRRVISANLRVGDSAAVSRVAAYARRASGNDALRVEAVSVLGVWGKPSNMDRVDGAWLGVQQPRDATAARAAVADLENLLAAADTAPAIKVAWMQAATKLGLTSAAPAILARLRSDTDASVRVAALGALQALGVPEIAQGVEAALADSAQEVRMAAIAAMPSLPITDAAKVAHLASVVGSGSVGEQQSALAAIGGLKAPEAEQALSHLADHLAAGSIAPAVQLELLEALRTNASQSLQARLDQLKVGRDLSSVSTVFPAALANGGSVNRGRQIVMQNQSSQCARCHTVGNSKSDVGPTLVGIASRLSREQLLEALVEPSARLAPGFGHVAVTLKDGRKVEGTLQEETETTLVIEDAAGPHRVAVAEVATRTNGMSAMPPMGLLLSPREIRDVVEFLVNQK